MTTLELSHVFKRVNAPVERAILSDISLRIAQGDFACIRGKSGAGKSTLLNILGLLDTGFEGEYLLDGVPVSDLSVREFGEARAHIFGFIFQSFHLFPDRSVLDNVLLGNLYVADSSAQRRERALDALAFVGLEERADQLVSTLSGGEQQRIAIARTVAADHDIIIADEPTGNLDSHSAALVLSLLQDLNRVGKTIVLVTHDDEVASLARNHPLGWACDRCAVCLFSDPSAAGGGFLRPMQPSSGLSSPLADDVRRICWDQRAGAQARVRMLYVHRCRYLHIPHVLLDHGIIPGDGRIQYTGEPTGHSLFSTGHTHGCIPVHR